MEQGGAGEGEGAEKSWGLKSSLTDMEEELKTTTSYMPLHKIADRDKNEYAKTRSNLEKSHHRDIDDAL